MNSVVDEGMSVGKAFHAIGPERENARRLNSSLEHDTNRSPRLAEHKSVVINNALPLEAECLVTVYKFRINLLLASYLYPLFIASECKINAGWVKMYFLFFLPICRPLSG